MPVFHLESDREAVTCTYWPMVKADPCAEAGLHKCREPLAAGTRAHVPARLT